MKKYFYFLLLLLLVPISLATDISGCGVISSSDSYILTSNLSSTGTCINITANNVTFDGAGHNITYSSSSVGYGINMSNNSNVTITNITILQKNAAVSGAHGIYILNGNNNSIYNTNINVSSINAVSILLSNTTLTSINNNTIVNRGLTLIAASNSNTINDNIINVLDKGIYLLNSKYTRVNNNTIDSWAASHDGIQIDNGNASRLSNNIIVAHGASSRGVSLIRTQNNTFIGGSISSVLSSAYYLDGGSSLNLFNNTNITNRGINFNDSSTFNYSENGSWVETSVSCYPCLIVRTVNVINGTVVNLTDDNYSVNVNITYSIGGLSGYSYRVYNTTSGIRRNSYNLSATNGIIPPFTLNYINYTIIEAVPEIRNVQVSRNKTNVTITWNTFTESNSSITHGRLSRIYTVTNSSEVITKNHSIVLNNLYPSTSYYYTVLSNDSSSGELIFRSRNNFTIVNSSIVWERLLDTTPNRTLSQISSTVTNLNADFIFRAWWRWAPTPNTCAELAPPQDVNCINARSSYEYFQQANNQLISDNPNVVIVGAVPAQRIAAQTEYNATDSSYILQPDNYNMSLDVTKWGINVSHVITQCRMAKSFGWINSTITCDDSYNVTNATSYFPDITNTTFQNLLLSHAKKQIDLGARAIWIDLTWFQAVRLALSVGVENQSSSDSVNASKNIIMAIRDYGVSQNREVYVGTWAPPVGLTDADLDFVTFSVQTSEVISMSMNNTYWNNNINTTASVLGNDTPIFAFFDWSWDNNTQLGAFYNLSEQNKSRFLYKADRYFKQRGIHFIYPVHGGMYNPPTTYEPYDSQTPETSVYDTILALSRNTFIVTPSSDDINISITTWNISGDYRKVWVESSDNASVTTDHTIGDFPANKQISISVDGFLNGTYQSNSTGYITYTYSGGYSEHEFEGIVSSRLYGTITDETLTPLSDVTVTSTITVATSLSNGTYATDYIFSENSSYSVNFTKVGYSSYSTTITFNSGSERQLNVILYRTTSTMQIRSQTDILGYATTAIPLFGIALMSYGLFIILIFLRSSTDAHITPRRFITALATIIIGFGLLIMGNYLIHAISSALPALS